MFVYISNYADVIWDQEIYVSEIKYQKYQQNIEGNSTLECEKAKFSKLARSARSHIHKFFQC